MTLWDTHCHLADPRFAEDRPSVLRRAADAGVQAAVVVAADPGSWEAAAALTRDDGGGPRLMPAHGLHPHEARLAEPELWDRLEFWCRQPETVALGEIGLDHHYDFSTPREQRLALDRQMRMAADCDLPIIIHEREAAAELLAILRGSGVPRRGGVWHCFSGDAALAEEVLDLGLYLGFGGLMTFTRGTESVRAAAARCPAERLLLETDAPYLSPVPHRGRRNEPARVRDVLEFLAPLRGISASDLAETTTVNACRLFGRAPGGSSR